MSDFFFEAKFVKAPKVKHTCQCCLAPIKGEHYKVSGNYISGFYNYHVHKKCFLEMLAVCGRCPKQHLCVDDNCLTRCFRKYKNKNNKNGEKR